MQKITDARHDTRGMNKPLFLRWPKTTFALLAIGLLALWKGEHLFYLYRFSSISDTCITISQLPIGGKNTRSVPLVTFDWGGGTMLIPDDPSLKYSMAFFGKMVEYAGGSIGIMDLDRPGSTASRDHLKEYEDFINSLAKYKKHTFSLFMSKKELYDLAGWRVAELFVLPFSGEVLLFETSRLKGFIYPYRGGDGVINIAALSHDGSRAISVYLDGSMFADKQLLGQMVSSLELRDRYESNASSATTQESLLPLLSGTELTPPGRPDK